MSSPSPERPRPAFDVLDHAGTRYTFVTDKETTSTVVQLSDLRPARNQGSVGGYRDIIVDQLFAAMFGARLDELAQSANAPFLRAGADRGLFPTPRTKDEAVLQALVSNDGVTREASEVVRGQPLELLPCLRLAAELRVDHAQGGPPGRQPGILLDERPDGARQFGHLVERRPTRGRLQKAATAL